MGFFVNPAMPTERSLKVEIKLLAPAYCTDGLGGQVSHVLINERSWKISYIVVKDGSRDSGDWIVPLQFLESSSENELRLSRTTAQLRQFEPFTVLDLPPGRLFEKMDWRTGPDSYALLEASMRQSLETNLPPGHQTLYWATQVGAADGQVGRISAVRYEPRHQLLSALVIQHGILWFKKEFAVPAHNIDCIEPEFVRLNVDRRQIEALPAIPPKRG